MISRQLPHQLAPRLPPGRRQERITKLLEELRYELSIGLIEGDQLDQISYRFMCASMSGTRYWGGIFTFCPDIPEWMAFSDEYLGPPEFKPIADRSRDLSPKSGNQP